VGARWEWRTFGDDLAGSALAAREPERVQESDEVYVLSAVSDASVKVRDGVLDVKTLQQLNADGLEQWWPVLKAPFPLSAEDAATVAEALGVDGVDANSLEALVDRRLELLALPFHKRRARHTVDGCMAELTQGRTERYSTYTVAVESEDPGLVRAAVRELGLEGRPNTCVARGLKRIVGFGRFAVIDVGTNSVKFVLAERGADGTWRELVDRAEVTRLGEGLSDSRRLGEEPIRRTVEVIAAMVDEARREHAVEIAAVGTAGMRMAENGEELIEAVEARAGVRIEVIPGEEEARLAYVAVTTAVEVGDGTLVLFDTGGGSSQFTFGHGRQVDERFSVNVGAARFTERFRLDRAVSPELIDEARAAIAGELDRLDGRRDPDAVVGIGGAVTNLAAVKHGLTEYDPAKVRGTALDRTEIDRQIELYRTKDAEERRAIPGLQPGRAEVILAGAVIVRTILEKLGSDSFTVSDRGLRHGLLAERFTR
jgi:exopolyphosphatase / guanosine-5'-triphosphate,3'-diphosphate pyrophosphatase